MCKADQLVEALLGNSKAEPENPHVEYDSVIRQTAEHYGVSLPKRVVDLWNQEGNFARLPLRTAQFLDWYSRHHDSIGFDEYLAQDQPGSDDEDE